jgi:hypothetical protein
VTEPGPNTVPGVGNYYIRVLAHNGKHAALTIYFLDTHSYSPDDKKYHGYDWIKPEQIKWFKETAEGLKKDNEKYSHIHLDMAFLHIPLPEYREAGKKMVGSMKEPPTAPQYNSGFRDALVEMGVSVASCGHDHANDYCLLSDGPAKQVSQDKGLKARQDGTSDPVSSEGSAKEEPPTTPIPRPKNDNIWLCYGGGVGFGGYGGYGGYVRRIRIFELDANEARIKTWKRLEYGDTGSRIDEQIIVDGGRVVSPSD